LTARDLYNIAGLNTDGVAGFFAQTATQQFKREVSWPAHLLDQRAKAFRAGSFLARQWLAMRHGYAQARRSQRHADFRTEGATSCLLPHGTDRKAEQLACLREVCQATRSAGT
jgi:hypothetical protein